MSVHEFSNWLAGTPFSTSIQSAEWAIPAIQSVHILALVALAGAALVIGMRAFGRGLVEESVASTLGRLTPVIWSALAVLLPSGALLIVAEPGRTLTNPAFYAKMALLACVVAITLWMQVTAHREGKSRRPGFKLAAGASLLAWAAIIVAGRFIAYTASF